MNINSSEEHWIMRSITVYVNSIGRNVLCSLLVCTMTLSCNTTPNSINEKSDIDHSSKLQSSNIPDINSTNSPQFFQKVIAQQPIAVVKTNASSTMKTYLDLPRLSETDLGSLLDDVVFDLQSLYDYQPNTTEGNQKSENPNTISKDVRKLEKFKKDGERYTLELSLWMGNSTHHRIMFDGDIEDSLHELFPNPDTAIAN